jgi:hypothetical protein
VMLVILEEAAAPDDAVGTVQPASRPALPQAGALLAGCRWEGDRRALLTIRHTFMVPC